MSRQQYQREAERELRHINEIIDYKILHGLPYREETRLHRKLVRHLGNKKGKNSRFNFLSFIF